MRYNVSYMYDTQLIHAKRADVPSLNLSLTRRANVNIIVENPQNISEDYFYTYMVAFAAAMAIGGEKPNCHLTDNNPIRTYTPYYKGSYMISGEKEDIVSDPYNACDLTVTADMGYFSTYGDAYKLYMPDKITYDIQDCPWDSTAGGTSQVRIYVQRKMTQIFGDYWTLWEKPVNVDGGFLFAMAFPKIVLIKPKINSVAPPEIYSYSTTRLYNIGDVCYRPADYRFYTCTAPTSGVWDSSKWIVD